MNCSMNPNCAVLLAAYNGIEYLEEQVSSILQQIDVKVTLYISIDISNDGTLEWCDELSKTDTRVRVLAYGERFGNAAKNFFRLIKDVDVSSYDYIAFSDQDDIWNLDKLINAIQKLQHNDYSGYSSNVIAFWSNGKQSLVSKAQPQKKYDFIFEGAGPGCTYVLNVNLMNHIKKHVIDMGSLFDNVWVHDWFIYAFARAQGYKWFIDAQPSMYYRQHLNNQIGAKKGIRAYLNRFAFIKDGFWFKQALLMARLSGFKEDFLNKETAFTPLQLLRLSFKARMCRRRKQDQILFFLMCLIMAIKPDKITNTSE